ncbi:hypothetical protein DQG23_15775 [Paenibacillus contaminans]|uniref:Uncharacterized protein n=1 Tax=Paenibacillus contaminans TaxID=450362 RepID=A0A329MLC5_9BACL|nr:hypothetical protein DQG23_15775 [Paenibacillus contaminans]
MWFRALKLWSIGRNRPQSAAIPDTLSISVTIILMGIKFEMTIATPKTPQLGSGPAYGVMLAGLKLTRSPLLSLHGE